MNPAPGRRYFPAARCGSAFSRGSVTDALSIRTWLAFRNHVAGGDRTLGTIVRRGPIALRGEGGGHRESQDERDR